MTGDRTAAMYGTLARWQWLRARWTRGTARRGADAACGLELRKRLLPPRDGLGPADGAAGLDRWLIAQTGSRCKQRVVDFGCGFGASLLRWLTAGSEHGTGVTTCPFQVAIATAAAARSGAGSRCTFVRQDFTASLPARFDVATAIESLQHAADLTAALRSVRDKLQPNGILLWVDDCLREAADGDADVDELAARWHTPPLRTVAAVRAALDATGFRLLRETDLTAQVACAPAAALRRRARPLAALRLLPVPPVRRLCDAFLGGVALERLYARGAACYRVWMSERRPEVT